MKTDLETFGPELKKSVRCRAIGGWSKQVLGGGDRIGARRLRQFGGRSRDAQGEGRENLQISQAALRTRKHGDLDALHSRVLELFSSTTISYR
jgi:hypothetical protein